MYYQANKKKQNNKIKEIRQKNIEDYKEYQKNYRAKQKLNNFKIENN